VVTAAVLPEPTFVALEAVGAGLRAGRPLGTEVAAAASSLNAIDPHHLSQAEQAIVKVAALYRWRREPSALESLLTGRVSDADQLRRVDGLELLFLFHRDGRLREAALRKLAGPLPGAFVFAAVAWRLNDWAEPVRRAAAECALRCFPRTAPQVIAEAAAVLLTRQATWRRWDGERDVLEAAFGRDDVAACLAQIIATSRTGPMASLLRRALRSDSIDKHLPRLPGDAVQPAVRAAALQVLIVGSADWPIGWRWRWIDKSMGVRRRETAFATRPLTVRVDPARLIQAGLQDRAAAVRNAAMAGLIRDQSAVADAGSLASAMLGDRSAAVRARAAFVLGRVPT
jgi:hypothetical protein